MAAAFPPVAPRTPQSSLEKQLSCSICLDVFTEPVTTSCGHSFCTGCLSRTLRLNNATCPLCKHDLPNRPHGVNIVLRGVVEQLKKDREEEARERKKREEEECDPRRFRGRPGQVACDTCAQMAATKSCLICLASYCDEHLQTHAANQRFKGHKLVDPVEDLDQRACLTHGRPLELYSRRRETCICVLCLDEGEEGAVSTEEAWSSKKAKLKATVEDLKESIMERKTKMDEINDSLKQCKEQLDGEWYEVEGVFSAVVAVVEAAQALALEPVEQRRRRLLQEAAELTETLRAEADALRGNILELEEISALEDHVLFLQKHPSLKELDVRDWTSVRLDTAVSFGSVRRITMEALEKIQEQLEALADLELRRLSKFAVDVTLDPATSHRRLVLSRNQKEVFDGESEQKTPGDVEGSEQKTRDEMKGSAQETQDDMQELEQETHDDVEGSEQKTSDNMEGLEPKTHNDMEGSEQKTSDNMEGSEQKTHNDMEGSEQKTHNNMEGLEPKTPDDMEGLEPKTHNDMEGSEQKTHNNMEGSEQKTSDNMEGLEPKTHNDMEGSEPKTPDDVEGSERKTPDDVQRFDVFGGVLGRGALGVGSRAYWEVQVGDKSGWDLGVASATAGRRGRLTLSPEHGYWAVVHYEGDKYAAMTAPPACVRPKRRPRRVGVFVDYDERLLSFYSVTDRAHIYTFSGAEFRGEIVPYFSPHFKSEKNTEALVISDVKSR